MRTHTHSRHQCARNYHGVGGPSTRVSHQLGLAKLQAIKQNQPYQQIIQPCGDYSNYYAHLNMAVFLNLARIVTLLGLLYSHKRAEQGTMNSWLCLHFQEALGNKPMLNLHANSILGCHL